ncbi:hypothetical protein SHIRM173S_05236 [Streptomyces hirsutus]
MWTSHDRPEDWLRAGQALERVLLTATRCGVRTSMLHQAMEWPDLRAAMAGTRRRCCPQLLVRFGYGSGSGGGRTPRASARPVAGPVRNRVGRVRAGARGTTRGGPTDRYGQGRSALCRSRVRAARFLGPLSPPDTSGRNCCFTDRAKGHRWSTDPQTPGDGTTGSDRRDPPQDGRDPWPLGTRGPGLGQCSRDSGTQARGLRFPHGPGAEAPL